MVEYGEDEKDAIYELIEITQGEEVDDPDGEESEEDDD